jgi:hypothetical protein
VRRLCSRRTTRPALRRGGINLPVTHGIVEITPEAEYLLVTDFSTGTARSATPR